MENLTPRQLGKRAYDLKQGLKANPFAINSAEYNDFISGYDEMMIVDEHYSDNRSTYSY